MCFLLIEIKKDIKPTKLCRLAKQSFGETVPSALNELNIGKPTLSSFRFLDRRVEFAFQFAHCLLELFLKTEGAIVSNFSCILNDHALADIANNQEYLRKDKSLNQRRCRAP